ncbi:MAG: helix-turn-helix domain-containing protein [Acutalibacteraceae bacterium]
MIIITTGYFSDIFTCFYENETDISKYRERISKEKNTDNAYIDYYNIIYIFNGDITLFNGIGSRKAVNGTISFAMPGVPMYFKINSDKPIEYLWIKFTKNMLPTFIGDSNFLRAFEKPNDDERIVYASEFEFNSINAIFKSLRKSILNSYGFIHMQAHISALISMLDNHYDSNSNTTNVSELPIHVKVINYIEQHFNENMTLKRVQDQFFLSSTTINTIVRNMKKKSFYQYVTELRLESAKRLLINGVSAHKVAEMVGFNSYSSFYRAFTMYFNHSPSDYKTRRKKWPLT